jgi:hypothetical protein
LGDEDDREVAQAPLLSQRRYMQSEKGEARRIEKMLLTPQPPTEEELLARPHRSEYLKGLVDSIQEGTEEEQKKRAVKSEELWGSV